MGARYKATDTANYALIYLFLAGNIGVEKINRGDQVDWVSISIRSNIRDLV